jgi:myo-inositol-1(or 4)-monophosphatase
VPEQPHTHAEFSPTPAALLAVALEAAHAAAAIIRDAAPRVGEIVWHEKRATDFVSEVDVAAEAAIIRTVRARLPDAALLAEESGASGDDKKGVLFVVDPLDGTTNFLHGYPEYAVSVGVLVNGVLTAGVIIDVPLGEVFTATVGGGAWRDGKSIRVSTIENPQRALIATGFPFTRVEDIAPYTAQLARVMEAASGVRRAGAAALDLASVAAGRFEGFWETRLSPWDIAAGLLLVREAGGKATTLSGEECPVAVTGIVASNGVMHDWLLQLLTQGQGTSERD